MTLKTVKWQFCDIKANYPELKRERIKEPEIAYKIIKGFFPQDNTKEHFCVLWLGNSNKPTSFEIISTGTLNSSVVHPREVFKGAIVSSAASIILVHNHPSGNLDPSNEDISITKKLVEAGKLLDIPVYDHLIISTLPGEEGYQSFVERRLI